MTTWTDGLHLVGRVLEAAPLVPLACAWVRRHNLPPVFRPVFYYVGTEAVFYVMDTLSRVAFHNNVYIYHLSTLLLVLLLSRAYRQLLPPGPVHRLLYIGIGLFWVVAVLDAFALNGLFKDVNSYSQAFGCALLIVLALLHVVHLTRAELPLEQQPSFFLSVSVLLYCSCSIVTYVASNVVYNSGYDLDTIKRLDTLVSSPDIFLFAVQMGLLAWMFCFFPLSTPPRQALPRWLLFGRPPAYRLLGQAPSVPGVASNTPRPASNDSPATPQEALN